MVAALSIFVLLSISIFVVRVASVALQLTGLEDGTARFQALSAFSGTGFTTSEAEIIVNYPIRRRIVSLLMVIGNVGLVSVLATVVVSFVNTETQPMAMLTQLGWLLGGLGLLWFVMLNKTADRVLCSTISSVLESTTFLGERRFQRLLQVGDGYSVCEHPVTEMILGDDGALNLVKLNQLGLSVLAVRQGDEPLIPAHTWCPDIVPGDRVVLAGLDTGHEKVEQADL